MTRTRTAGTCTPTAVLLPGTGSDDKFVREVFHGPLTAVGIRLVAPAPVPGPDLAEAHLAAMTAAAANGPVLAGGISLGAHLAAEWALRNPRHCTGLLLALPAWNGRPGDSPAAVAARLTADAVRAHGLDEALATATAGVQPWLANELTRAWRRHGDGLVDALGCAATHPAPSIAELAHIRIPAGVAACADDPVHPFTVAEAWARALPDAAMVTTSLSALAGDRESLGRATVLAWLRAGGRP